jgi:hypothetical protein
MYSLMTSYSHYNVPKGKVVVRGQEGMPQVSTSCIIVISFLDFVHSITQLILICFPHNDYR